MKRKIIEIDEALCNGCGECIPACPEGAIQLIDGKARLLGDLFCDGLGACLGHCPQGAITVEEREAAPYDERQVMANIIRQGPNVIRAHLDHLREHGEDKYLAEAVAVLEENNLPNPLQEKNEMKSPIEVGRDSVEPPSAQRRLDGVSPHHSNMHSGCPGARSVALAPTLPANEPEMGHRPSQLRHWPIQLHLMSPTAPHYRGKDVLVAADCTAFAVGDFHKDHLKDKALAIACPKLDQGQEIYVEKIRALIDDAKINTLTVMIMQVPCCMGLLNIAQAAASQATRKVPIKCVVVSLQGEILQEEWV